MVLLVCGWLGHLGLGAYKVNVGPEVVQEQQGRSGRRGRSDDAVREGRSPDLEELGECSLLSRHCGGGFRGKAMVECFAGGIERLEVAVEYAKRLRFITECFLRVVVELQISPLAVNVDH